MEDREETQRISNNEEEIKGQWIDMSIGRTKSNGHDEGEKRINLIEIVKNLQKDIQSYEEDNEMLRKSKEQQDDFNIKML